MSSYPLIAASHLRPSQALNWARNGIAPSAADARRLAGWLNGLGATRKKRIFAKSLKPNDTAYTQTDDVLWRTACHTGPFTSRLRAEYVLAPTRNPSGDDSGVYWISNTGLAGAGTTVTHDKLNFWDGSYTGTIAPDQLVRVSQYLDVSADTDYTLALHDDNGVRVCSAILYEEPLSSLYTAPTGAIDGAGLAWGLPVESADVAAILSLGEKLWKRGCKHFGGWTEKDGISRTTASYANAWKQSVTTWAAGSPGLIAPTYKMGSLDSANVSVTWAVYAKSASGTGKIAFENSDGKFTGVEVASSTAAWYSGTFNLDSAATEEKLDLMLYGSGAGALTVYAVAAWCHVA